MTAAENATLTEWMEGAKSRIETKFGLTFEQISDWLIMQALHKPSSVAEMSASHNSLVHILSQMNNDSFKQIVNVTMNNFRLDVNKASKNLMDAADIIFSILWYSKLPCFDVKEKTSEFNGEASLLRLCKWKGKKIPCSKIFKKVTTDQGVCCAFNMKKAETSFRPSLYTKTVEKLRSEALQYAFEPNQSDNYERYQQSNEPKSQSGSKMGLTVVLDAHTDLISEYSWDSDYKGMKAAILERGDFPLLGQNAIEIKPGHINVIPVTATVISAESSIENIDVTKRNCYFEDERDLVKLHKNYTQFNCLFECALAQAKNISNHSCVPWFFPSSDANERMCDPWEKAELFDAMENEVSPKACEQCLPDCVRTIFQAIVTTQEFKVCDENNWGMSELCSTASIDIWPQIWGTQVLEQLNGTGSNISDVLRSIKSSYRTKKLYLQGEYTFTALPSVYDAYKEDIAVVNVYFASPTAMKFTTKIDKTWIDFISGIGGNVGLFIGFSFVTIFELIWLFIRIAKSMIMP